MLEQFLDDLLNGRQVRVSDPRPVAQESRDRAAAVLGEFEREYRVTLPGEPPELDPRAAVWGAVAVYSAAALLVHRNRGAEAVDQVLDAEPPDNAHAGAHYAVDLTLRFLPDLTKLAKSASSDDPLLTRLRQWATAWPLSSVGMQSLGLVDATPLRTSPTLMRLYADRIMKAGDSSRLDDPAVAAAVRAAVGGFPELCPSLAKQLEITPTAPA